MSAFRKKSCFTLIELLVVVSIIMLLMAMLLPALKRARENAYLLICKNNQRQIGLATNIYAEDFDGQVAMCNWATLTEDGWGGTETNQPQPSLYPKGQRVGWLYESKDAYNSWIARPYKPEHKKEIETGGLWPYIGNIKTYQCPASPYPFTVGVNRLSSYMMSNQVNEWGQWKWWAPTHKIGKFRSGDVLLFEPEQMRPVNDGGEEWTGPFWGWIDGSDIPCDMLTRAKYMKIDLNFPPYHMYRGVEACFDGHVGNVDADEWMAATIDTGKRTRYYCSPSREE